MTISSAYQRLMAALRRPRIALAASTLLLAISASAVYTHTVAIAAVKERLLPASLKIPGLEQRLTILKQQLEVSELQASLRLQSPEEMLHAYVLPKELDITRMLATFDVLRDALQSEKQLASMDPIVVGTLPSAEGGSGLREIPLNIRMRVTEEGLQRVLSFIDMAGMLTVADAFSKEELEQLLRLTEQENPAAIAHLEQFLAADVESYAKEPKPFEEQMFRAFSDGPLLDQLTDVIRAGRLASVRDMLDSSLGQALTERELWPMRFLLTKTWNLRMADKGLLDVELGLVAFSR